MTSAFTWSDIPAEAVEEKFIQSAGPGGQNVNKVATAVQLSVAIGALGLSPEAYKRLKDAAGHRLTADRRIVITARQARTQAINREAARARILSLINAALIAPVKRKKSRLNRVGKAKRLKHKKARGTLKAMRGKVRPD